MWTLINAHGAEKSFAEWGLGNLRRKLVNQAADGVTFTAPGAGYDGEPLFAYGETLTIRRDGVPWFQGRVIRVPRMGEGRVEAMRYELAGPWWYLDDLVFQQSWKQLADFADSNSGLVDVSRSRVVIGQSEDGGKINSGVQLAAVIDFAVAQGRPLQRGVIEPTADIPWDERQDPSCAEIIRRVLRWSPDAVTFFDYATTPPTLHVRQRQSLAAVTVRLNAGPPVKSLQIAPRYDLQRSVVVLKYEQTQTVDGNDFTRIIPDQYPPEESENAIGALTMTLELGGGTTTYQHQAVTTAAIHEGDGDWWKEKLPWLRSVNDLTLTDAARDPDTLENELQSGTVSEWMGRESGMVKVTANLSYTRLLDPKQPFDSDSNPIVEKKDNVPIITRVRGTDATTGTFTRLRRFTAPEPVPQGLARSLYQSVSVLPYEGVIELKEDECGGVGRPGSTLHLLGGRAEWATMSAAIQIVEERVDGGETRIEFGPPKHLGAEDLLGLLRMNRNRVVSYRAPERSSGKPTGKAEVDGIEGTSVENATCGVGPTSRLMVMASSGSQGKVTLDAADCNEKELKVRELEICEDGVAKKILVLCSESY